MSQLYDKIANSHESFKRNKVWCRICKREQNIDSAKCLKKGWPKCCGYTMTIDHPDTWVK